VKGACGVDSEGGDVVGQRIEILGDADAAFPLAAHAG